MAELQEAVAPLDQSLDLTRSHQSFCGSCDPRVSTLIKVPIYNNILLDKQLSWEPLIQEDGKVSRGEFVLDRYWCSNFQLFPDCEAVSRLAAGKLVARLNKFGGGKTHHVADEASYKLGKSFLQERCKWVTEKDLLQKVTFLPTMAILSEDEQSSTKCRIVQIPNRPFFIPTLTCSRTYNSFIRKSQISMSSLNLFYIAHMITTNALFLDYSECFNSLKLSYNTSLHNLIYCLERNDGLPTYNLARAKGPQLKALRLTHSSFGKSDIPSCSKRCIENLLDTFLKHGPKNQIPEDLITNLRFVLKHLTWVDDSLLYCNHHQVISWALARGRPCPQPPCACKSPCHSWTCKTRNISNDDLSCYHNFLEKESMDYLLEMARAIITISDFSSHKIKVIKAISTRFQSKIDKSDLLPKQSKDSRMSLLERERPCSSKVNQEIKGDKGYLPSSFEDQQDLQIDSRANQLGKSYKDDTVYLKNTSVYLAYFANGAKRKSPRFSDYSTLKTWRKSNKMQVSRLTLSSFVSQLFDWSGRHLSLVRTYCKESIRRHLKNGSTAWNSVADEETIMIFERALEAFFLIAPIGLPRSNLFLHPAAQFIVLSTSDGGETLHGITTSLISYLTIDKVYKAKAQHLGQDTFVNHILLCEQMHYIELLAAFKMVTKTIDHLQDLKALGINVSPSHVIFTVDSRYVLLVVRSTPFFFKKKVCALVTRIQQTLAAHGLCPYKNFCFIKQHDLPPFPSPSSSSSSSSKIHKQRYFSDILSKTRKSSATRENILSDFYDLQCVDWLEMNPKDWSWIERQSVLPALSDQTLLEIGACPDNLEQLRQFLQKKRSINHFQNFLREGEISLQMSDDYDNDENPDDSLEGHMVSRQTRAPVLPSTPSLQRPLLEPNDDNEDNVKDDDLGLIPQGSQLHLCDPVEQNDPHYDDDDVRAQQEDDDLLEQGGQSQLHKRRDQVSGEVADTTSHQSAHCNDSGDDHDNDKIARNPHNVNDDGPQDHLDDAHPFYTFDTRWQTQVSELISRKLLYSFSNKSFITILEYVLFYINRLRILSKQPSEKKEKIRLQLKAILEQNKRNCGVYCGRSYCTINNSSCIQHSSPSWSSIPTGKVKPGKIEKHLLFLPHLTNCHQFGIYEGQEKEFFQTNDFWAPYKFNPTLRTKIFHQMCLLFSKEEKLKGFEVVWREGLFLAKGRLQRNFISNKVSEPRFRIIDKESNFMRVCIKAAHESSLGKSPQECVSQLFAMNVICDDIKIQCRKFYQSCHACNINKAYEKRNNYLIQSKTPGPSSLLESLGSASSIFSQVVVDLTGKLFYRDEWNQKRSIYFLVCVSCHFAGQTRIIPIKDKTTHSIIVGFKTLVYSTSSHLEIILCDAGTEFLKHITNTSTMAPSGEPLAKKWYYSLTSPEIGRELQNSSIVLQFGKARHSQVCVVENKVRELKRTIYSFKIFGKDIYPTTIQEIYLIVSMFEYILDTRPVAILGNQVYSVQDLKRLCLKAGKFDSTNRLPVKSKEVSEIHSRLSEIYEQIIHSIFSNHLDSLLITNHPRENYKQGHSTEILSIGTIVFDQIGYRETGVISGNLARVLQLGESKRFCLIQKSILKPDGSYKSICVSRPTEHINYIASPDHLETYFCPVPDLFQVQTCLGPKPTETIYRLPDIKSHTKKIAKTEKTLPSQMPKNSSQGTAPTPVQVRTRAGRVSNKPQRLGFD